MRMPFALSAREPPRIDVAEVEREHGRADRFDRVELRLLVRRVGRLAPAAGASSPSSSK